MLFAVCCDRGSPGSTTAALALAAARGLPAVVVEADPFGGDLALRLRPGGHELPATPTVLGMSAGRSNIEPTPAPRIARSSDAGRPMAPTAEGGPGSVGVSPRHLDLWRMGSHQLSEHVRVVPGFLSAEQGSTLAWRAVAATARAQTVPVFADLGRIHTGSPSMPIAEAADALIVVCRGDRSSVEHLIRRLEHLVPAIAEKLGRPPLAVPVVITKHRHGSRHAAQVAELLAETSVGPTMRGAGWLAWDPDSVTALEGGGDPWASPLQRSPLMQSARKVMWLLGLATGLDHATPESKRRGRRKGGGATTDEDQPQTWAIAPSEQPGRADAGSERAGDRTPPPPPLSGSPRPPGPPGGLPTVLPTVLPTGIPTDNLAGGRPTAPPADAPGVGHQGWQTAARTPGNGSNGSNGSSGAARSAGADQVDGRAVVHDLHGSHGEAHR